jgi:NitT/TauT family transport system substrate-binding protein
MYSKPVRLAFFLLTALLLITAFSGIACTSVAPSTVRIGYLLGDLHQLPFFVAQEKGFFKDAGVNVQVVGPFDAGPAEMDAIAANQLDIGYVGVSPAILAAARKIELSVIAGVNLEGSALATANSINSITDLKAKKVATPAPGSMQYILMGMLVSQNKMSLNDLELFPGTVKPPDMAQALQTGRIDGYFVWEPYISKSVVSGSGKVLVESKDIWAGHPCCVIVTRNDFAANNDVVVSGVVRAHRKAVQFIETNPSEAKIIAQKWTKLDAAVIDAAFGRVKYTYSVNKDDVKRFVQEIINLGTSGTIRPIITVSDVPDIGVFVDKVVDLKYLQR